MRCIETFIKLGFHFYEVQINYNMRCIETQLYCISTASPKINYNMRCIETFYSAAEKKKLFLINYNMRCIETGDTTYGSTFARKINYNMRCIETNIFLNHYINTF